MSAVTVQQRPRPLQRGAERPRLHVVRDTRTRRRVPWLLVLAVLLAGAVLTALTLTALAAEDAVRARELQSQVTEAEREYAQLVAKVATLESPERIAKIADRMGLVRTAVPRSLPVDRLLDADVPGPGSTTLADGDGLKPLLTEQR